MIVIIAGSRNMKDRTVVMDIIDQAIGNRNWEVTEVISGCAPGVDTCVLMKPWSCPVRKMPADWTLGRSAGYRRNAKMADIGEALVAIWDGRSRGTLHMIECMKQRGKPFQIFFRYPEDGYQ